MDDTEVVIKGVDQTGPAFKSAARNAGDLDRALRSVGQRGYKTPTESEWRKRSEWMRNETNQTKVQAQEQERANRRVREGAGEVASMAARYVSLGFAIDQARTGVLNFARDGEQLRVLQARSGAAREEMERLKRTVADTADEFGRTQEEVVRVVDEIREAGYMSVEQARQIAPSVVSIARQFGVEGTKLAGTLGEFMNTMNIPASKAQQALNMMAVASNNLRVEFSELNKYAPELGENMKELGVTGVEGLSKVMAVLGMMRENGFGSTTRAARFFQQALNQIRTGGGVAGALGFDNDQWSSMMERHLKSGGDFFDFYISRIKEARDRGAEWSTLFSDPKQARFWQMMIEKSGQFNTLQKELRDESLKTNQAFVDSGQDAQLQLDRLTNSWTELWKAIGSFAGASGATSLMQEMTAEMKRFSDTIEKIKALMDKGLWGAAKDVVGGMRLPSASEVWQGMVNGPVPKKDPFRGVTAPISRANGGPAAAGVPHMIGERGPELFTPQTPGTVTSNNIMADVDRNTERSSVILNEIRDILRKEQQDRETSPGYSGGGGGSGGASGADGGAGIGPGGSGGGGHGGGSPTGSLSSKMGALATQGGSGAPSGAAGHTPKSMGGGAGGAEPQAAGAAGGPSTYNSIAEQRADMFAEMDRDPETKKLAMQMMATEGGGGKALESMMNRIAMIRKKVPNWGVKDELRSGFYGPINRGEHHRANVSGAAGAKIQRHMDAVRAGSDEIEGRTDQGLLTDPNGRGPGRLQKPGMHSGEVYNFWKGSRRGKGFTHADSAAFAAEQQRLKASGGQTTTNAGRAPGQGNGLDQPALNQRPEMPTEAPSDLQPTKTDIRVRRPQNPDPDGASVPGVDMDAVRERARSLRSELEEPITIRTQMARGQDSQFRRASMRREVNREVRESAWNSYNDIGAA